jgi:hypothetical protein
MPHNQFLFKKSMGANAKGLHLRAKMEQLKFKGLKSNKTQS